MFKTLRLRIAKPDPAPPWSIGAAFGYIVGAFALMVIGSTLASLIFGQTLVATIGGWSLGTLAMGVFVALTRSRTPEERQALGVAEALISPPMPIILIFSVGMGVALDLISLIVTRTPAVTTELLVFFGGVPGTSISLPFRADAAAWLLAVLFMVAFQPIGEELIFRGMAYPALRARLGGWGGFILTAGFHALFHLIAYTATPQTTFPFFWYALILPLLDGLYLGAVRAYTRSTRAAIVAHIGLSLFAVIRALILAV